MAKDIWGAFTANDTRQRISNPASRIDRITMGIKANISVAGLPLTAGIEAYADRIASRDAECVALLRNAGVDIIGTTNMHEGALGTTTDNPFFGRTHNPWRHGFTAGGSSGGSAAAVAAELCDAALGTDTFGSVRIPAAYCGLFGLKPARGAISLDGIVPLSWTFDHAGILARNAQLCRDIFSVIGTETQSATTGDIRTLGPGLSNDFEPISLPAYEHGTLIRHALLIAEAEASVIHGETMRAQPAGFSPDFQRLLNWGANQPAVRLANAYHAVDTARGEMEAVLTNTAALILPSVPHPAHSFDVRPAHDPSLHSLLASILGWPAVTFPYGLDEEGLPLSRQVMARTTAHALDLADALSVPVGSPFR